MNQELIQKLRYSKVGNEGKFLLPHPLNKSLQIISDFFLHNANHKLCLVFPAKEYAAQWLSIPTVLFLIQNDFDLFKDDIFEAYRNYRLGEKLILNNRAIVEWLGVKNNGVAFKTKASGESSGAEITIKFSDVIMLHKAPASRKVLSSLKSVKEALPSRNTTPIEKLLDINTYGNQEFIKNKVCLVTKFKSFDDSINNITLNMASIFEYFQVVRISEDGTAENNSPLLISNNLSNLALHAISNQISKIIIDGLSAIQDRATDFSDIDEKKIPTILVTDLSEIESFEFIGNFGFEFYNFTKDNLNLDHQSDNSPFHTLTKKLYKYFHFNIVMEICQNTYLEKIIQKIYCIEKDDSNHDLSTIKVCLIQLTNLVSRICHIPTSYEISSLNQKLSIIINLFQRSRMWVGDSLMSIEESISLLKSVIEKLELEPSEKCVRLKSLMSQHDYDYIICPTEDEVQALKPSLSVYTQTQVISIADVNDNLLSVKPVKALITGWAKSGNMNRILSSFLFSELTVLFYQYENKYYNSLQRRNKRCNENIKSTISNKGILTTNYTVKSKGFDDLYAYDEVAQTPYESSFDILDFELRLDKARYSKYTAKGNLLDSIKAKRVDFENDFFMFSTESHKFLVINELIEGLGRKANLYRKKLDSLRTGDIIALINSDRDLLSVLVEIKTNKSDFFEVKQWTDLWKNLLKDHFASVKYNFGSLVGDLRKWGCKKHETTIKTWLQDVNRIGPDDDSDLISIALMVDSKTLLDNISKVRESITKMKGWRMKAADFIIDLIKTKLCDYTNNSILSKKFIVEDLGSANILKIAEISKKWEDIDYHFVNRLLQKEEL